MTLADFWGIQNVLPEMDDNKGTSLIFVNSKTGQMVFEQIKDNILSKRVDINEAIKYNLLAIKSAEANLRRKKFFEELDIFTFLLPGDLKS